MLYGNSKLNVKKRRARRAASGARKEIVGTHSWNGSMDNVEFKLRC